MNHSPFLDRLRQVLQTLHASGISRISNQAVYECFEEANDPAFQARVRRRMDEMVGRKELERVAPGVFIYQPQHAPQRKGFACQRIYRAVRASQPGFSAYDIQQVSRIEIKAVRRYLNWLHQEGYLAPHGRQGNTRLWRVTAKAREQREAPYIPMLPPDPYEQERNAACRLVRLMMARNLDQPSTRRKIAKECWQILNRFAKEDADDS